MKTFILIAAFILPSDQPGMSTLQQLPHSEMAQVYGSFCQTPFGVCPLVQSDGSPYTAPVRTLCFCGKDPGQVRQ